LPFRDDKLRIASKGATQQRREAQEHFETCADVLVESVFDIHTFFPASTEEDLETPNSLFQ